MHPVPQGQPCLPCTCRLLVGYDRLHGDRGTLRPEVFRTVPEVFPASTTSEQTCSNFTSEHFRHTSEHFG